MARVRHMLIALLAVIGLLCMPFASAEADACPADTTQAMAMHHQHGGTGQPAPADHALAACPACLAVLASPADAGPHRLLPFAPFAETFQPLSGIDPALDPPPPRAA